MTNRIPCYWLEPAGRIVQYLRRYDLQRQENGDRAAACPGRYGYHNAEVRIGELAVPTDYSNRIDRSLSDGMTLQIYPASDPRWPTKCDHCDYVFREGEPYQYRTVDVMRRVDTGEEREVDAWGPGAIYEAWWERDRRARFGQSERFPGGPDGRYIVVRIPDANGGTRVWTPDLAASFGSNEGKPWTREGDPARDIRTLTIRPSILFNGPPRFHAWLTAGVLEVLPDTEPWE